MQTNNSNHQHRSVVANIADQINNWKKSPDYKTKKLRFNHGGTNSTKPKSVEKYFYIDISSLNHVLEVNTKENYALVEPNVSMDALIKETLKYNLIPPVVMEFPGITVGGAIQGAALESSSFKFGQFNQSAFEYEVVLASGEVISASNNVNSDLFYGMTGAYGSLGLLTLIKLKLVPAAKYIQVTYAPVNSFSEAIEALNTPKQDIDYLDCVMFSSTKGVIVLGKRVSNGIGNIQTFSKATDPWFYKHAEEMIGQSELVPITDYLFRYNRGSFWTGEFFFKQMRIPGGNNMFNRTLFNPFLNTRKLYEVLHHMNWTQRYLIQDIYFPVETTKQALDYFDAKLKIYPLWLCPVKNTEAPEKLSPNYLSSNMLIDIGIWGIPENLDFIEINRDIERMTEELRGRKMFYAQTFYSKDEFWGIYDHEWYNQLRRRYQAEDTFPDIYEKVHVSGKLKETTFRGFWKLLWSFISLKNLNS